MTKEIGSYQLIKLDKRFNGYAWFKYALDSDAIVARWYAMAPPPQWAHTKTVNFQALRIWCWDQWGPSMELDLVTREMGSKIKWAWETNNDGRRRIYVKGDEELSHIILAWSDS